MAVGMAELSHLESRLRAVLNPRLNRQALPARYTILAAICTICAVLPLASLGASAQAAAATISGIVYDASGAVVPKAVVTVSNLDTHSKEIVSTTEDGRYAFASIPAGRYLLEVRKRGFALFRRGDVVLNPNAQLQFDPTLEIGAVSETIDVVGQGLRPVKSPSGGALARVRVGGEVQATKLIRMMRPVYPESAKQQGIEGTVLLHAVIAKDGSLLSLGALNTLVDPELVRAAMDAVSQWRYPPTLLNGVPVEVDTTVTVNFRLAP